MTENMEIQTGLHEIHGEPVMVKTTMVPPWRFEMHSMDLRVIPLNDDDEREICTVKQPVF